MGEEHFRSTVVRASLALAEFTYMYLGPATLHWSYDCFFLFLAEMCDFWTVGTPATASIYNHHQFVPELL
jgi:hypothetical protein